MNREIKFRAWEKENKIMFYSNDSVDGRTTYTFFFSEDGLLKAQLFILPEDDREDWEIDDHDAIPMQYTGMKDKNGVEIYEGDIVRLTIMCRGNHMTGDEGFEGYSQGQVIIHTRQGVSLKKYFTINEANGEVCNLNAKGFKTLSAYRSEVIGNIYEHPELLTPKPADHDSTRTLRNTQ